MQRYVRLCSKVTGKGLTEVANVTPGTKTTTSPRGNKKLPKLVEQGSWLAVLTLILNSSLLNSFTAIFPPPAEARVGGGFLCIDRRWNKEILGTSYR